MKRPPVVLLLGVTLLLSPAFAAIPPSNLIGNIPNRTTINLNGAWHAIVDPFGNGERSKFFLNQKAANKSDLVEYSFDESPVLNVPGDWNTQRDQLMFYEGPVWYRREFLYQKKAGKRVFVYFGAANYKTTIFINGEKLGQHEGGFTAFNFEVTQLLREGSNFLIAEVNNSRCPDGVPGLRFDWWNYGGITRDVLLVEVPDVFVQDYSVQFSRGSMNEISGWLQLNGSKSAQKVMLDIPEAGIHQELETDASGRAVFRFPAKLEPWSPEHPKLYDVTLTSSGDVVHDQIGFRSIEVRDGEIWLNGRPIFLRGIAMHEEAPFREGRAFSKEDAQTLFGWVKDLGCNFVRLAHYPHNENEIRLADRLGLLVWSEIPVYWDIDWQNPATLANAETQLRDMIARDHNRAAVILWSLSNETPIKPERLTFIRQLAEDARKLDSTRLVTSATDRLESPAPDARTLADPLGEFLDVIGLNEYIGWYWKKPEDADTMQWKSIWNKPIIVSEFGAGAPFGLHGDSDQRWTEEYQSDLYERQIRMLERIPNFAGMSPWVLMDFRSPGRMLPGVQDFHNRKGLISDRGQKKLAFYTLQKYYQKRAAQQEQNQK